MEWKDSGKMIDKEETAKEEYFDEEQYSPWADRKEGAKGVKIAKVPVLFFLLVLAIVALVAALLMLVMEGEGGAVEQQQLAKMEQEIGQLQERLDKYEAIDEKVTLIWEQAKSFEKFKDRFDRSEASMSLRMDHLTMSLEAMQKQSAGKAVEAESPEKEKDTASEDGKTIKYHQVKAGETLYSISKRYGLKVTDLRVMNNMSPDSVIQTGQKLIVRKSVK